MFRGVSPLTLVPLASLMRPIEKGPDMTQTLGAMLTTAPPLLSIAQAEELARRHYAITGSFQQLTSERDANYRIKTPSGSYVLKLANPAEPREVTDFQTRALLHLEASNLPVPHVIRSTSGAIEVPLPQGVLRVLTYLEGQPQHLTPQSRAQSQALAAMAARVTLALQGFDHPAAAHFLQWDIKQAANLRPLLGAVPPDLAALCRATLDRFDTEIAPVLAELRAQVVHNDLNPHNVLVDPADPTRIAGILDFGDMVKTPLICDAAVAGSYLIDPARALESLVEFLRAYHAVLPLTATERRLFPDLVAVRMLTTITIASTRAAQQPENAPYILRNLATARPGMMALAALDRKAVTAAMEAI